jgi:hypothetical protein
MAQMVGILRDNNLVGTSATNNPIGAHDDFCLPSNDRIEGRTGDDRLFGGGSGNDFLDDTGDGNALFGRAGDDRWGAVSEGNTLDGGSDDDLLTSAGSRNGLLAGDGKDELATEIKGAKAVASVFNSLDCQGDDSLTATANAQAGERSEANASNNLAGGYGRDRLTAEATADIDAFGRASTSNLLHGGSEHA